MVTVSVTRKCECKLPVMDEIKLLLIINKNNEKGKKYSQVNLYIVQSDLIGTSGVKSTESMLCLSYFP